MKRSGRRNLARLLALESLESRRLMTTAMPDSFSLLEDSPTALLDVMANDIVTGNVATIVRVSSVNYGNVEIRDGDKIAFTPAVNAFGETLFTYTIRDQFGTESTGTAAITISAVNDAPTINQVADIRTNYNEIGREVLVRNATAGLGEATQDFTINATSNRPDLIRDLVVEKQAEAGLAKLKFQTAGGAEGTAVITVEVRDSEGLTVQRLFTVDVIGIHSATPLQNSSQMLDVDTDGFVGPLDALIVINRLNFAGDASIPASSFTQPPPPYIDVNGDNYIDPSDAISIIDALNHSMASLSIDRQQTSTEQHLSSTP